MARQPIKHAGAAHPGFNNAQSDRDFRNIDRVNGQYGRDCRRRFLHDAVWTWRGLVTYYTVFVIDLASRRVQIVGSTLFPNDTFIRQVCRTPTAATGILRERKVPKDRRVVFAFGFSALHELCVHLLFDRLVCRETSAA